jgi:hypothetical protein
MSKTGWNHQLGLTPAWLRPPPPFLLFYKNVTTPLLSASIRIALTLRKSLEIEKSGRNVGGWVLQECGCFQNPTRWAFVTVLIPVLPVFWPVSFSLQEFEFHGGMRLPRCRAEDCHLLDLIKWGCRSL